ncbi:MAG: cytochrome-c peroxidase [Methyloprofundus sp.]|nr:cytochrome-c peroxidase [Methyloprofundus sp.]
MHKQKKLDRVLKHIINVESLTGNPLLTRTVPSIDSPQAQLGMDLFFSKTLGGDGDSACVACHHPSLGGGDNLALPVGVEADEPDLLGVGRTNDNALNNDEGGPPVPRNAPTTFNVVAWDKFQFHDGRVESLDNIPGENGAGAAGIRTPDSAFGVADPLAGNNLVQAQARFPVTSNEEMKGFNHTGYTNQTIRDLLADRLAGYADDDYQLVDLQHWLGKFRVAFADPDGQADTLITEQNISLAISEYERSQAFVNTPWKNYIEGNKQALSVAAKKGAILFYTSTENGGAGCSSCHAGDFFTDESFHNLAMPQIGPGKGDGADGSKDFGRARETGLEQDKFAFRTPSLINVEVTGPWSHAGAYSSLEAVVKHHLNAADAIATYDTTQLTQAAIRHVGKMTENTEEALDAASFELQTVNLGNMQVGFLVEFLKALTDPCTQNRECLGQWIPDGESRNDPNGDQLNAVDQYGNLL